MTYITNWRTKVTCTFRDNEEKENRNVVEMVHLTVEHEARARSAPPLHCSPPLSPAIVISPPPSPSKLQEQTNILIEKTENGGMKEPPDERI